MRHFSFSTRLGTPPLLTRHVQQARQILKKLLPERLIVTPQHDGSRSSYTFEGTGRLEPVVTGLLPVLSRPERARLHRWWPQRDSNPCLQSATRFLNRFWLLRAVDSTTHPLRLKFGGCFDTPHPTILGWPLRRPSVLRVRLGNGSAVSPRNCGSKIDEPWRKQNANPPRPLVETKFVPLG
jgi:hypothetical protein